jgi:putative addiction module CopG family antidote
MTTSFPLDIQQFVRQELASGNYCSEEELVMAAVRFLRDSEVRLRQLRAGLKDRLSRLDHGEGIELGDDEALGTFLDQVEGEVNSGALTDQSNRDMLETTTIRGRKHEQQSLS